MEREGPRIVLQARRRETAAEQMSRQQQDFEKRSGPVRDEAVAAAAHNETHPKLKRQLEKRRSVTEFLDHPVKRMRLSKAESRGGKFHRRRTTRRKSDRPRRPRINRVAKRRDKRPCTCSKCLKKPICRKNASNFCVYVVNRRVGTDAVPLDQEVAVTPKARSIQGSRHSVGLHSEPSRHLSVSSYNSFDSADHQPMV